MEKNKDSSNKEVKQHDPQEAMSFASALRNRAFKAMNSSLEMEKQGRRDIAHNKITLAIKSDPSVPLFHVIRGEK